MDVFLPPSYLFGVDLLRRCCLLCCVGFGVDTRFGGASVDVGPAFVPLGVGSQYRVATVALDLGFLLLDVGLVLFGVNSRYRVVSVVLDLEHLLLGVGSLFDLASVSVGFGPVLVDVADYMRWLGGGQAGFEIDSKGFVC